MKKHFGLFKISTLTIALLVVVAMAHPSRSMAQTTASIHGHVNNPINQAITKGDVKLTTDRTSDAKSRKYQYTFPIDQNGDYKGTGITAGNYVAVVFVDNKSIDFNDNVALANGDDKVVNFDMSRADYIAKMTPDEKKQLEEYKKKNAEAIKANSQIANLNKALGQARALDEHRQPAGGQEGHLGQVDHFRSLAAENQPAEKTAAMRAHDDKVRADLLRGVENAFISVEGFNHLGSRAGSDGRRGSLQDGRALFDIRPAYFVEDGLRYCPTARHRVEDRRLQGDCDDRQTGIERTGDARRMIHGCRCEI